MSRVTKPEYLGLYETFDGPPRATDAEIREAFDGGATVAQLSDFLCRSESSIRHALARTRNGGTNGRHGK